MTWFRIDDTRASHPKFCALRALGAARYAAALAMWVDCGCWSSLHGTGGVVPGSAVADVAVPRKGRAAADLVRVGLWVECKPDGSKIDRESIEDEKKFDADASQIERKWKGKTFRFHDWGDRNPSAEEAAEKKRKNAERQRRFRAKRNADGNALRSLARARGRVPDPTRPDPTPIQDPSVVSMTDVSVEPYDGASGHTAGSTDEPNRAPWLRVYREWATGYEAAAGMLPPHPGRHEAEAREVFSRLRAAAESRGVDVWDLLRGALLNAWGDPWWTRKSKPVPSFSHFARYLQRYVDPPRAPDPEADARREHAEHNRKHVERTSREYEEWRRRTFGDRVDGNEVVTAEQLLGEMNATDEEEAV